MKEEMDELEQNKDSMDAFEKALHSVVDQQFELALEEFVEASEENQELNEEDIIDEITNSLAKQVEVGYIQDSKPEEEQAVKRGNKLAKRILISVGSVVMTLLLLFVFVRYTTPGQNFAIKMGAWFAAGRTNYDDGSKQEQVFVPDEIEDDETIKKLPELRDDEVILNADEGSARHEDYATNILLLGEESMESATARGRTDAIIIVTLNSKDKSIKLTSLMRDLYVQIPGHLDNKLNSAYATGGIPLLYETIELNFDLKLDGYVLVGFNDFERIIDLLDGVDIKLTKTEANYLNKENFISNPKYRDVEAGWNHMNGNQALGYSRVRYVGTEDKLYNDFGRTSRHRTVINAIFDKYKTLGLWDLVMVANSCLPMITTDLDASEIEKYLKLALDIGMSELQQYRIPVDGAFEDATIRKMSVIVPNLQKNVAALHEFIFGAQE